MTAMRFGGQTVLLIHAELADIVGSDQAGRLIMSWIDKGAREFAGDLADSTASLHG